MRKPAAVSPAARMARRAAYLAFCSTACASSDSAATMAACTGPGTIIPACLPTSSRSFIRAGSPVTKPAR